MSPSNRLGYNGWLFCWGAMTMILFYRQSFDEEPVFESENIDCSMPDPPETSSTSQPLVVTSDEFQIATQSLFDEFIAEIKVNFVESKAP